MGDGPQIEKAAAVMLLGAMGLGIVSYGTVAANVPEMWSPYSLTVALAGMDEWGFAAFVIWPVLFLFWGIHLFARRSRIPFRSIVLMALALMAGVVWVVAKWRTGVVHQGGTQTAMFLIIDIVVAAVLTWLLLRSKKEPTFLLNFAFHWLLFAWIAWGSIPWLGEGI
jgi:hypothetical protein